MAGMGVFGEEDPDQHPLSADGHWLLIDDGRWNVQGHQRFGCGRNPIWPSLEDLLLARVSSTTRPVRHVSNQVSEISVCSQRNRDFRSQLGASAQKLLSSFDRVTIQ
jgi:hypothetical protein